jgi:Protein of unknown function (DUF2845)
MRTIQYALALHLALGALLPAVASADDGSMMPTTGTDSFRCGSHLVETGMTLEKVQEYCGAPTEQTGDRWIYARGPDKFTVIIHIQPDNTVGMIEEQSAEE